MLNHIKKLSLILSFILIISTMIAVASPVFAISGSKEDIINSAKLFPVKTGYRPLDKAVDEILSKLITKDMSSYSKIKAVYDYMIINYAGGSGSFGGKTGPTAADVRIDYSLGNKPSYSSSTDRNIVDRALTIIESHVGTCLHYSSAFVVFARAMGFEAYRMYGATAMAAGGMGEHYWPVVIINGEQYVFDAQVDDHIAGGGSIKYWRFCLDNNEARGLFSLASPASKQISEHNCFDMSSISSVKVKGLSVSPKNLLENSNAEIKFEVSNPDDVDLLYNYYYLKGLVEPAKNQQAWQVIKLNSKESSINWTLPEKGVYTLKADVKHKDTNSTIYSTSMVVESKKYDPLISLNIDSTAILLGSPLTLDINTLSGIGDEYFYDFSYTHNGSKKQNYIVKQSSKDKISFTPNAVGSYVFNADVHMGKETFSAKPVSVLVYEDYIKGDFNLDTKLTAKDARLALLASGNLLEYNEVQKKAGDVNEDGRITAADARTILRLASGMEKVS